MAYSSETLEKMNYSNIRQLTEKQLQERDVNLAKSLFIRRYSNILYDRRHCPFNFLDTFASMFPCAMYETDRKRIQIYTRSFDTGIMWRFCGDSFEYFTNFTKFRIGPK